MYELLPGVVSARITPPIVPPQFIVRTALLEVLNRSAPNFVFAVAPSGFGKTILAAQWAAQHPENTIWYTASPKDSAKDTILHYISALRRIHPKAAPWAEQYRDKKFDVREATILFGNEIAKIGSDIYLITDNADSFSKDHIEAMEAWAESRPGNLRSLIIRQHAPISTYTQGTSTGSLETLGPKDFAFRLNEIEDLTHLYSVDFPKYQKELDKVQNWPAGIMMTLKSLQGNHPTSKLVALDAQTVINRTLENLSPRHYKILEKLVFLDELTNERAGLILEDPSSSEDFAGLVNEGIFILPVGGNSLLYEINDLIREAIASKLKSTPDQNYKIKYRCAEVLEKTGDFQTAITYFGEIGEVERASKIFHKYVRRLLWSNDIAGLEKCAEMIANYWNWAGAPVRDVINAFNVMTSGTPDELTVAIKVLSDVAKRSNMEKEMAVDLTIMKCRQAFSKGDFQECIAIINRIAEQDFLGPSIRTPKALFALRMAANAAFLAEDLESLEKITSEAILIEVEADEDSVHLPTIKALQALAQGKLKEASELAKFVIARSEAQNFVGIFAPVDAAYCLAECLREFSNEEGAILLLEKYLPIAETFHIYPWVAAMEAKYALIESQQGFNTKALHRIRKVHDRFSANENNLQIHRIIDEHELIIRAFVRDFERMDQIIYRAPKTSTFLAVGAILKMRKGGIDAKQALANYKVRTVREQLLLDIIMIQANIARPQLAEPHMRSLVSIAVDHGYRQTFLIQSPEFQEYVTKFAFAHPTVYMEQISRQIREQLEQKNNQGKDLENPLTKREIEILNRLSTGIPISQIAVNLHISNNTIKTHLKNVYKKLGAESRESAVAKGRELLLF